MTNDGIFLKVLQCLRVGTQLFRIICMGLGLGHVQNINFKSNLSAFKVDIFVTVREYSRSKVIGEKLGPKCQRQDQHQSITTDQRGLHGGRKYSET